MRRATIISALLLAVCMAAGCTSRPLTSKEGNVVVTAPRSPVAVSFTKQTDGTWQGTVHLQGKARAFEAVVSWEAFILTPSSLNPPSLGQGSFMTSAGAPEFGTFDVNLELVSTTRPTGSGTLRIFIASAKDGSQTDIVDIALTLQSGT